MASTSILSDAAALIERGLPCFPCGHHKKPTTPHGFKNAARHPDALRELWRCHWGPLIGVPTGEVSGLDVLDIDARHGAGTWFAEHRNRLPSTRVHRTRSGGLHLLFQHQPGLRCSAGRVFHGVDIRADGGYVIWWPAAGCPVLSDAPWASWPEWLLALLNPPVRTTRSAAVVPNELMLTRLVRSIVSARPGERNSITFWAACRAGEMVLSGLLRADFAASVIAEAGAHAGLPLAEARRTAWSGIRATGGCGHA